MKNGKKRSSWVLLLVLTMIMMALAACTKAKEVDPSPSTGTSPSASESTPAESEAPKEKVEIQFWNPFTGEGAAHLDQVVSKFNESQNEISVKTLSNQDPQKQLTAISGGSAPDLVVTYWNNVGPWSAAGAVLSLEDFIKKDGYDTNQIIPAALDRMKVNGQIYGFPISMSMANKLLYNKKLFEEAGVTTPPETLEDLFDIAKKLTKKDDKGNISQMGFIPDYPWLDNVFWPIIFSGTWDDGNGKLTANQPANVSSIEYQAQYYKEFGESAIAKFKSGLGGMETEQDPILTGKLAMMIGWENWYVKNRGEGKELGVAPFPYPKDHPELKNSGMVSPVAMFIPAKAKHPDAAWKLIQYLTSEDVQIEYNTLQGSIPIAIKALENPKLTQNPDTQALWEYYESAKSPNLKGFPNSIYINEYLQALNEETEKALKGQITAQTAMDNVVKKMQPVADKK